MKRSWKERKRLRCLPRDIDGQACGTRPRGEEGSMGRDEVRPVAAPIHSFIHSFIEWTEPVGGSRGMEIPVPVGERRKGGKRGKKSGREQIVFRE